MIEKRIEKWRRAWNPALLARQDPQGRDLSDAPILRSKPPWVPAFEAVKKLWIAAVRASRRALSRAPQHEE